MLEPDPELLAGLTGGVVGEVVSTDLYYDPRPERWEGAVAVDLSTAALFAVAARHGVRAACVLVVSESPAGRIESEALGAGRGGVGAGGRGCGWRLSAVAGPANCAG